MHSIWIQRCKRLHRCEWLQDNFRSWISNNSSWLQQLWTEAFLALPMRPTLAFLKTTIGTLLDNIPKQMTDILQWCQEISLAVSNELIPVYRALKKRKIHTKTSNFFALNWNALEIAWECFLFRALHTKLFVLSQERFSWLYC